MSDKVTNAEILRAINRLESEISSFKYWALAIFVAIILALFVNNTVF